MKEISHLFFDLGGVCLTNAWDHISREADFEFFHNNFMPFFARLKIVLKVFGSGFS